MKMGISVRQKLVSADKFGIKCPYAMSAEYITIHNTANDASADAEVNYMISNSNQVSYHFAIDDKEVVQGVPLDRNAWHCGDGGKGNGNRKSIGVEVCYSKSGGERYQKAEALAIKFVAQLLHERGWGVDRVKKHQDWSGKNCPHRILAEGRWADVIARIQTELNALKAPAASIANTATVEPISVSDYVGKTLVIKTEGLWHYNTPRWDVKGGEGHPGDTFIITEELSVNGARMVKCHDGKYRTADPAHVDITPKPSDWPYRVVIDGITHAQAAEIVNEIQAQYKNAKVEGQAK